MVPHVESNLSVSGPKLLMTVRIAYIKFKVFQTAIFSPVRPNDRELTVPESQESDKTPATAVALTRQ
jgi:hypothetical protein